MKTLTLLLGSPRRGGNSERLAEALAQGAAERGYQAEKVPLAEMTLKGCTDCRRCWSKGSSPCILGDDMDRVYGALERGDLLVFVTPLYFFSWSTQIKPVWDRLIPYVGKDSPKNLRGKGALLLATAGDDEPEVFEGLAASFRLAREYMKWEDRGSLLAHGVYARGDIEKGDWLKRASILGSTLP